MGTAGEVSAGEMLNSGIIRAMARNLFNPNFCEKKCPICTSARQGNRVARFLQRIELLVTFGGCPWGRARQRKCGAKPDEAAPKCPPQ